MLGHAATDWLRMLDVSHMTWNDALDILIVAVIIYQVLVLLRGTRGAQMALGIVVVIVFYYISRRWHLETVQWILTNLLPFFFLAIIIIFQVEIRRGLMSIGKNPFWRSLTPARISDVYDEIVLTAITLASQRIGGLLVIEREVGLKNYIESGVAVNAQLTYDLLMTIFNPHTPLHDGAVIVQHDKISAAACFLPLTLDPRLSKQLGTRHRAAIGITEETDAVAVVVSEETGAMSIAVGGRIERDLDGETLLARLYQLFQLPISAASLRLPAAETPSPVGKPRLGD
ncbi:MAG: diadenylate cyclase CdaA [Acidobacteriia bacterium]|nr:diadenylate cyclase CdaA [Terriglobia bacterium]